MLVNLYFFARVFVCARRMPSDILTGPLGGCNEFVMWVMFYVDEFWCLSVYKNCTFNEAMRIHKRADCKNGGRCV